MHVDEQPKPLPKVVIITLWNLAKVSNSFAYYSHALIGIGEDSVFWNIALYRQITQIPKNIHK
jgi:hypothetical protein